jgi:hypothetical protein
MAFGEELVIDTRRVHISIDVMTHARGKLGFNWPSQQSKCHLSNSQYESLADSFPFGCIKAKNFLPYHVEITSPRIKKS